MTLADDLELPPTPRNMEEALGGPWAAEWKLAVQTELNQLLETGTIKIMNYIPNAPIVRCDSCSNLRLITTLRSSSRLALFCVVIHKFTLRLILQL
jgi:hypothetical protein